MNTTDRDLKFDAAMRALHQASLEQLTPAVRWKLKPGAPAAPARRPWLRDWRSGTALAGVAAAVFAIAIGMGLQAPSAPTSTTPVATTQQAPMDEDSVYDQDPDFYAWLASDDADLVAME